MTAMTAKSTTLDQGESSGIFRPEVFYYQRWRFLGVAIDPRPLHMLWCVAPIFALVAVALVTANMQYQPRGTGKLAAGAGQSDTPFILEHHSGSTLAQKGDRLLLAFPHNQQRETFQVSDVLPAKCSNPAPCVKYTGKLLSPKHSIGVDMSSVGLVNIEFPMQRILK